MIYWELHITRLFCAVVQYMQNTLEVLKVVTNENQGDIYFQGLVRTSKSSLPLNLESNGFICLPKHVMSVARVSDTSLCNNSGFEPRISWMDFSAATYESQLVCVNKISVFVLDGIALTVNTV